jgi:hypothetical protein
MISAICSKESKIMNHWKSVFCDNASITIEITTQWSEVPDSFWAMAIDKIPVASSFLNKKYISAMSGFCQTWLTLFYENKRPIGWAVF